MPEKPVSPWKSKLDFGKGMSFCGYMFLILALVLVVFSLVTHGPLNVTQTFIFYTLGLVLFAVGQTLAQNARLTAYRELLPTVRDVNKLAQAVGLSGYKARREITMLIRRGKLNALYVDKETGAVVLSTEEAAARPTANGTAPNAPLPVRTGSQAAGLVLSVPCSGCGALTRVSRGQTAECQYCGAIVEGK